MNFRGGIAVSLSGLMIGALVGGPMPVMWGEKAQSLLHPAQTPAPMPPSKRAPASAPVMIPTASKITPPPASPAAPLVAAPEKAAPKPAFSFLDNPEQVLADDVAWRVAKNRPPLSVAAAPEARAIPEPQEALNLFQLALPAPVARPEIPASAAASDNALSVIPPMPLPASVIASASTIKRAPKAVSTPVVAKAEARVAAQSLEVTLGKARIVNLQYPASRVSLSNPDVASVVVLSPKQVQIVGSKVGVANLLIWDDAHADRYSVVDITVQRDVTTLSRQIRMIDPQIVVMPMAAEDSVILTGAAASREQAQLAVEIAKAYFTGKSGGVSAAAGGASGAAGDKDANSMSPGSAAPGQVPNIINLIRIQGEPSTKAEAVRLKLRDIDPNIRMDVAPGLGGAEKVILTGKVRSANVISRAINLTSVFYGKPGLTVLTGPGGNAIRQTGKADFQGAEAFNDNMDINILQGSIVTDASGNVVSMMEVSQRPQILCRVKVLDVNRAALKQLGSNYLGNYNDVTLGSFSGSQSPAAGKTVATLDPEDSGSLILENAAEKARSGTVKFASGVNPVFGDGVTQFLTLKQKHSLAISALVEKRKARSLAEPTLVMLSGEKASFLAGGEIPIPVTGTNGQISIEYHEFGIRLNLIATVDDDGKIHLQIAPEVSTVDNANAITTNAVSVPAFATRRFQTTVELMNGESFVMAGLFNQEETESASHLPGVGSIPFIGAFFRSKYTDRRDHEMVVILQPEVVIKPDSSAMSPDMRGLRTLRP